MPRIIELQVPISEYIPIKVGTKSFQFGVNDRDYRVGDVLRLREWDELSQKYTGETCWREVTYITKGASVPIPSNYAILSLRPIKERRGRPKIK